MTIRAKLYIAFGAIAALTIMVGLFGLFYTSTVGDKGLAVGQKLAPQVEAAKEIEIKAGLAHLLFEEIMAGDENEDISEVWELLDQSLWYANAILNGAEDERGRFYPTESAEVREKIEIVRTKIAEFVKSGEERYGQYTAREQAGSGADAEFDALYQSIQSTILQISDQSQSPFVLRNAGQARYMIANAHLFLEEILAGDTGESFDDVVAEFRAARIVLAKLNGTEFASQVPALSSQIERLVALASQRYATINTGTAAGSDADQRFDATFEEFVEAAEDAATVIKKDIELQLSQTRGYQSTSLTVLGGISLAVFLLAGTLGYKLSHNVTKRVGTLSDEMVALSEGYLNTQISFVEDQDEIGAMARTMAGFRTTSVQAAQSQSAVAVASASFMIVDQDGIILNVNKSALSMFSDAEEQLRIRIADFSVENLAGTNISQFRDQSFDLGERTLNERLVIGERIFDLIMTPVINKVGERLGTAIEWKDMTAQLGVEREVAGIVHAASEGDFSQRLREADKSGFFADLAKGMNELLDVVDNGLNQVVKVVAALAEGDLTTRMQGQHKGAFAKLKDDADRMGEQMEDVLGRIANVSSAVKTATDEISSGITDLSTRTEHQASSLEETSASMEELSATVRQNSDNAQEANQVAVAAREAATTGGEVAGRAIAAMGGIEESSRQITDIVGLIQEIAFQTNLLALNASVEAARAGEAGRGFAVVANEVRALAQRAATASKDIKQLITSSDSQVQEGAKLVNEAGASLEEIVASVKKVADYVSEIAAASNEQTSGLDQVSSAVTGMDEMTQQNAALVEETTGAIQSAMNQVNDLQSAVGFFQTRQRKPATPREADNSDNPVHHQQRLVRKAAASAGALALKDDDWQEF